MLHEGFSGGGLVRTSCNAAIGGVSKRNKKPPAGG
jgi:hypothetical protein